MPVTPKAVPHLQGIGHDAIHASSVGLSEATDREILATARRDGRILARGPALDLAHAITVVDRARIRRHPLPPRSV